MKPPARPLPVRIAQGAADVVIGIFVIAAELVRPLYRPLYDLLQRLAVVQRLEAAIARLPPYLVLLLLAVPFLGVEPLKILAVFWLAEGRVWPGLALMAGAYLGSFVLVERIYHAGRAKLFQIGWFAAVMDVIIRIREAVLARVRSLAIVQSALRAARRVRARLSWLFRRQPKNPPSSS